MSENSNPQYSLQQISVGNIVNLGVNLYRAHLKQYFKLSLIAHLWLLVPIYGYAKFYALAALISRLAFCELIGQPESPKIARSKIKNQLLKFLLTGIFVTLIPLIQTFGVLVLFSVIYALLNLIFDLRNLTLPGNIDYLIFIRIGYFLIFIVVYILLPLWFYSPLFLTDLPLVIEDNVSLSQTIKQSRQLIKKSRKRIISIILVSFLITLPTIIIIWIVVRLFLTLVLPIFPKLILSNSLLFGTLFPIFLSFINGVIFMPMWQAIKAVVYFDFISQREGWGLNLRSPNIIETNNES
ncbi:hypothetical protein NIES4074_08670 [Cylindrospermum sp. NIES-4074]|nr:hypothetical protein NIES4074_08670 [Cylindrospermum sp. NIES-4074]